MDVPNSQLVDNTRALIFPCILKKLSWKWKHKSFCFFQYEEESEAPWIESIKILTKVHDLTKDDDKLKNVWDQSVIQPYVQKAYKEFPSSQNIIKAACYLNDTKVINHSKIYAQRFVMIIFECQKWWLSKMSNTYRAKYWWIRHGTTFRYFYFDLTPEKPL